MQVTFISQGPKLWFFSGFVVLRTIKTTCHQVGFSIGVPTNIGTWVQPSLVLFLPGPIILNTRDLFLHNLEEAVSLT